MPVHDFDFDIHSFEQLKMAVRLGGFLRLKRMRFSISPGMTGGGVRAVRDAVTEAFNATEAGYQMFFFQLENRTDMFGSQVTLKTDFFDAGGDRLFVRWRVYDRARELAGGSGGKPSLSALVRTVRRDIPYGVQAQEGNPCCVSSALRARGGVCQAIALYFCQLALRCGYQAVVRVGKLNGEAHAWNMICVNGVWRRVDLCCDSPYARYEDHTPLPPGEQYRRMSSHLEREIRFGRFAELNGLRLPFYLTDGKMICPTRFVQLFNGAYARRKEDQLTLFFGNRIQTISLATLENGPGKLPVMPISAFAELFQLSLSSGRLCFREQL